MSLNPPLHDWAGRRVWIVGASSGIGRAVAEALHAQGATVIVSARQAAALQAFADAAPGRYALPLDVTDRAAVERAAVDAFAGGPLDLILFCPGTTGRSAPPPSTPTNCCATSASTSRARCTWWVPACHGCWHRDMAT